MFLLQMPVKCSRNCISLCCLEGSMLSTSLGNPANFGDRQVIAKQNMWNISVAACSDSTQACKVSA